MPARRLGRCETRATLTVDGEDVPAVLGEPIAVALYAANRLVLGRSVKYHRPRGAACFAGRCDGCLMRVDGVPSVRTCRTAVTMGCVIETQNVLGSAGVDLLSAADWFFPGGMNHHEMFTWARPVNRAMQEIARRVAGIGTLPDVASPLAEPERIACDVLVIGAGAAGLACAEVLALRGIDVCLLEEDADIAPPALARVMRGSTTALGIFDETRGVRVVLAQARDRLVQITPKRIVIAQGRAETSEAFEGNDKPGVISRQAAERLFAHDVLPGERAVLVSQSAIAGESPRMDALAERFAASRASVVRIARDDLLRASGRSSVRRVETKKGARHACDVLVVEGRWSTCFELAAQGGVEVVFDGEGFALVAGADDGVTAHPDVFVAGTAAGASDAAAHGARVGAHVASLAAVRTEATHG